MSVYIWYNLTCILFNCVEILICNDIGNSLTNLILTVLEMI